MPRFRFSLRTLFVVVLCVSFWAAGRVQSQREFQREFQKTRIENESLRFKVLELETNYNSREQQNAKLRAAIDILQGNKPAP